MPAVLAASNLLTLSFSTKSLSPCDPERRGQRARQTCPRFYDGRMEIPMISIRRFAFSALLAVTTISLAPTIASAQEPARGKFTLTHAVNFGKAKVPAGDYQFTFDHNGISSVIVLSKVSGAPAGYMVMVRATRRDECVERNRSDAGNHFRRQLCQRDAVAGVRHDVALHRAASWVRTGDREGWRRNLGGPVVSIERKTRADIKPDIRPRFFAVT